MCWFIVLLVGLFFLRVEFIQLCDKALQTAKGTCNQVLLSQAHGFPALSAVHCKQMYFYCLACQQGYTAFTNSNLSQKVMSIGPGINCLLWQEIKFNDQ